jgi:hypothetical protein
MNMGKVKSTLFAIGLSVVGIATANASTFATFSPIDDAIANLNLVGTTLSSSSTVTFDYKSPGLVSFGDLTASLSLTGTETGAVAFGPIGLATFDGSFSFTYAGPTKSSGGHTVKAGDDLLSGSFLGAVATHYGTSGSLLDSILAGGLVSFNSNKFLAFTGLGDEGLALAEATDVPVQVIAGKLTPFSAITTGSFSADGVSVAPVPLPASVLLLGPALFGLAAVRRRSL